VYPLRRGVDADAVQDVWHCGSFGWAATRTSAGSVWAVACRLLSGGSAAMTNGQAPDGHHRWEKIGRWLLSVHGDAVRLIFETGIDP
jgi:hypothetical protein